LNTLDVIIVVLVLIPALFGLKYGLLRSIFSLIGIIAGLVIATKYNDKILTLFNFLKLEPKLVSLISFVAVILSCYFISIYLAGKISRLNAVTRSFDKILGVILGIFKGLILSSLFLIFTTSTFTLFGKETVDRSKFRPDVINIAPEVYDYLKRFFPDAKGFYEEMNNIIFTAIK